MRFPPLTRTPEGFKVHEGEFCMSEEGGGQRERYEGCKEIGKGGICAA